MNAGSCVSMGIDNSRHLFLLFGIGETAACSFRVMCSITVGNVGSRYRTQVDITLHRTPAAVINAENSSKPRSYLRKFPGQVRVDATFMKPTVYHFNCFVCWFVVSRSPLCRLALLKINDFMEFSVSLMRCSDER